MTQATMHAPAPAVTVAARLAELIAAHGIETIVETHCGAGEFTTELAALGPAVLAIDVRPEAVTAARRRVRQAGWEHVHIAQGHAPRVLADMRLQLPRQTIYVLGAREDVAQQTGDELFMVPRGQGVIVVPIDRRSGAVGHAAVQDHLLRWSPDHHTEVFEAEDGRALLIALPRPRVHVTFLIEKYTFDYGTSGISINLDNLVETLAQTGLATWNVVHYDQCFHEGRAIPLHEISKPAAADVHVLVSVLHYHSLANPTPELLQQARASGTKVALVWLDKKISKSTPDYYRAADLNVVLDGNDFELPNAWPIFTPKNPNFFHDPGLERDIDVSLVGEVRYLSQRKAFSARLAEEKRIAVRMFKTSAADTGRALSVAEYAQLYQRSKISLVMTKDAVRQLKGRVFEVAHCGAMLLCDVNHNVSHYLEPGVDYVTYRDYEDLVAKCQYYLTHEEERLAIARQGHLKVKRFYNHDVFWRSLLARLGGSATAFHGRRTEREA